MMPGLLYPLGLAALVALIVPLVIHIARRTEDRPTDFAALRWLRQKPRPKSRLRFDERLLLAIRLLLLALVALWLAQPALFGAADQKPYVAVAPGADLARAGQVQGRPVGNHQKTHWLAPDFPALDQPAPTAPVAVASLIRQLDADLPAKTPLILIVPEVLAGADAERPKLSRKVEWRVVPGTAPTPPLVPEAIPPLSIRHDAAHAGALRYLRAAALSWQPEGRPADLDIASLDAGLPEKHRRLIWLGTGSLPPDLLQWVETGGTALVASDAMMLTSEPMPVWRDDVGQPLIEVLPRGSGRMLRFTRPLVPAEMPQLLEPAFPAHLQAALAPLPVAPSRVAAADYAPSLGGRHIEPAPAELRPWLAVLIGLVLLAERWLATRRRRGLAP